MNTVVTIDGPAGSGKSTTGLIVARRLGFLYLDTGAMYRAVALAVHRKGIDSTDHKGLDDLLKSLPLRWNTHKTPPTLYLDGEDISHAIRDPEIDILSSRISTFPQVREAMTELQRAMGAQIDLVAEGRDMGTVVFPHAQHKFYLTASPEVRIQRRYLERVERGEPVSRSTVEKELLKRDAQDCSRSLAPLRPAEDASIIDTSNLSAGEVVEKILEFLKYSGLEVHGVTAHSCDNYVNGGLFD